MKKSNQNTLSKQQIMLLSVAFIFSLKADSVVTVAMAALRELGGGLSHISSPLQLYYAATDARVMQSLYTGKPVLVPALEALTGIVKLQYAHSYFPFPPEDSVAKLLRLYRGEITEGEDVAQGPIQRRYGLGTLVVHTAGVLSTAVSLPGLPHERALAMRDAIRAQIREEPA